MNCPMGKSSKPRRRPKSPLEAWGATTRPHGFFDYEPPSPKCSSPASPRVRPLGRPAGPVVILSCRSSMAAFPIPWRGTQFFNCLEVEESVLFLACACRLDFFLSRQRTSLMPLLFSTPSARRRILPNQWDLIAFAVIMAALTAVARSYHGISAPLPAPNEAVISLDYWNLPYYALRTALRMFAALFFSLLFTFTYATLAAKSRRWEMVLIPVLDILQSVPILGFLSFTVTFFLGLFPGNTLGAELAAIFAIFTSQAWNMAFAFYQSLRTVPRDLDEVARGLRLTGWQKFWQLEAPFAMPGLIWNTMMSMSGGWFFVVASEAITVGNTTITLPGVGSYIAKANDEGNWWAIGAAVLTMAIVILLYDQLLFRPIVAWADKFRVELSAGQEVSTSWVLNLLQRTHWLRL